MLRVKNIFLLAIVAGMLSGGVMAMEKKGEQEKIQIIQKKEITADGFKKMNDIEKENYRKVIFNKGPVERQGWEQDEFLRYSKEQIKKMKKLWNCASKVVQKFLSYAKKMSQLLNIQDDGNDFSFHKGFEIMDLFIAQYKNLQKEYEKLKNKCKN